MKYFSRLLLTALAAGAIAFTTGAIVVVWSEADPAAAAPPEAAVPLAGEQKVDREKLAVEFFDGQFQPFLRKYCFDCHSGTEPESDVRLDQQPTAPALKDDRQRWMKVVRVLRSRRMPPKDETQPPVEQRDAIAGWLDDHLNYVDCNAPREPGYVTIRRLNRTEYRNTVRDLLGVEFALTDDFPADDVGYGFDNIGDVLTLPPLLMEKYLDAAERVTGQVLAELGPEEGEKVALDGDRLKSDGGQGRRSGDAWWLNSKGEVYTRHRFPTAGQYTIRLRAEGDQAGDEPVRAALSVDGKQIKVFDVKKDGIVESFDHVLTVDAGEHRIAAAFINDYYRPEAADPAQRDRNMAVHGIEIIGPRRERRADESRVAQRVFFAKPGDGLSTEQAAATILRSVATRAFRRPARDDEVARLVQLALAANDRKKNFEQGIALALQAVLASPKFLFKVEAEPSAGGVRPLDEFELATRMSYFLWSTMPDDELFQQATAGTLRKNLDAQIRRLLADERSRALAENFATQWLGLRNLQMMQPDEKLFPSFTDELQTSMYREAVLFFDAVVREDRSVLDLIDANFTFADQRLARHYGIDGVTGQEFHRVSLAGSPRGGVLMQAGVLTVTSNPTRTSPVKRGKWIMENILGTPPPDPPPNVPELDETQQARQSTSLRERLEQHRADPNCAVCHRDMDELGFAMENFDAVGRWRTKEGRFDIDASGKLPGGEQFSGPAELKKMLRVKYENQIVRCLAEKMLTYAIGRGIEYYDRCTIDDICHALAENDHRFSVLVTEIIRSQPFQKRKGK